MNISLRKNRQLSYQPWKPREGGPRHWGRACGLAGVCWARMCLGPEPWRCQVIVLVFSKDLPPMSIHQSCVGRKCSKFYCLNIYLIAPNIYSSHTTRCLELLFIFSLLLSGCSCLWDLPKIKVHHVMASAIMHLLLTALFAVASHSHACSASRC